MPTVTVREAITYVEALGWTFARWGKGDHRVFSYPGWRRTLTIPGTLNEELAVGTWSAIRREAAAPHGRRA